VAGAPPTDVPYIDLSPYLAALLELLEITGIIPDPISGLIGLFSGRPKPEATAQVADWLMRARNPAARIWGIEIARYLVETGAVLSDGHPAVQAQWYAYRTQFVNNLERQGVTALRASQIADLAYSVGSQGTQPYPPILTKPLPAGYTIGGPQSIEDLYHQGIQQGESLGYSGNRLIHFATQWVLEHATLLQLWKIKVGNPQKCTGGLVYDWPTDSCVNPIPHLCPPGTHWDADAQACVPDLTPPPPPPPQCPPGFQWDPVAQKCVPMLIPIVPQDQGDELTECCQQTAAALAAIAAAIQSLVGSLGQNPNPGPSSDCCANITAQLSNVVDAIANLTNNLGVTVDLAPVATALDAINATLAALPGVDPAKLDAIAAATKSAGDEIASAIANQKPTDVAAIVEQLRRIADEGDVKQSILDYLVSNGYIDAQLGQLIAGAPWADALIGYFRTWAWNAWNWWLSFCGVSAAGGHVSVKPLGETIAADVAGATDAALKAGAAPLYPVITGLLDAVVTTLNPTTAPTIANTHVDQDLLLSKTLAPALIVNAVAMLASYFGWEIAESLERNVELVSEFLGLQEVRELKVGQRMRFGPMREAELQAKALYRQELPGVGVLAQWNARRLIDNARYKGLLALTGIPGELEGAETEAAYRGIQPFILIRLLESGLFSDADLADELTFTGIRPASQHRIMTAAAWLATNTYRNQLIASAEKAYVAGILSDADLTAQIDSANSDTDRDSLLLARGRLEKLVTETKALEVEYTTQFLGNLIDDATFRANLQAIGLQPDMVNIVAGKAEARAQATLQRKLLAAEAAETRRTQAVARQAALKNFEAGNVDAASLTAALVATGLTAAQATAWVDLAVLRKAGSLRWLYGLQLAPAQAQLLRERVAALTDQRKRQLLTDQQYVDALKALGIPPKQINALRAAADAMVSPRTSAVLIPVSTT